MWKSMWPRQSEVSAGSVLTELQEVVPRVTVKRVAALLIMLVAFLAAVVVMVVLAHFVSPIDLERYGYFGVMVSNLLPSLSVVIPAHFFLPGQAVSVIVAAAGSVLWAALAASVGSTLGEVTAYYVGYGGKNLLNLERFGRYHTAERWMRRRGGLAVALFAFLPLFFFDVVGIAAGALRFPFRKFLFFCYLGRLPRAFIEIYFYTWIFENIISRLPDWMSGPLWTGEGTGV